LQFKRTFDAGAFRVIGKDKKTKMTRGAKALKKNRKIYNGWLAALGIMTLTVLQAVMPFYAMAMEVVLDTSVGYDSNPGEAEKASGSAFFRHGILFLWESQPVKDYSLTLSPSMVYRNFIEVQDNHEIGIEAAITSVGLWKRVRPSLFAETFFYRDDLIETDERDEVKAGVGGEWLVSSRFSLSLEHAWLWTHYLSDAVAFAHGERYAGKKPPKVEQGMDKHVYPTQEDSGMTTQLLLDILVSPFFTASFDVAYEQVNSSIDQEAYRQITPVINFLWEPTSRWQIMLELKGEQRDYNNLNETEKGIRRINDMRSMDIKLSRFWGDWGFFTELFLKKGEHPLHRENYFRREAQCGLSRSF
jgi:hypothetical protein